MINIPKDKDDDFQALYGEDFIDGYKKIGVEEYRLVEKHLRDGFAQFDCFPSDGLWIVHRNENSRSTSRIFSMKKLQENPEKYPLVDLALRKDDISTAILRFLEGKEKTLSEMGKSSYSISELTDFIVKYLVAQELGGGSKKVLIEKKWIKVEGDENKRNYNF